MIASRIAAACRALGPSLATLFQLTILLGGAFLVAYGAWLAYRPAGFAVGGVLLLAGVILHARGRG